MAGRVRCRGGEGIAQTRRAGSTVDPALPAERIATADDPRRFGKALTGGLAGLWRYRIGDYRVVATFEDKALVVLVLRVAHRREVYD